MTDEVQFKFHDYIPEINIRDHVQVIMRRRWIVITFFTMIVTTVVIGTFRQKPIYEAAITLLIEQKSPNVVSFKEVSPMGSAEYGTYRDYYETQYKLITSRPVIDRVADGLSLKSRNAGSEEDTAKRLLRSIKVKPVKNSQLVEVSAENPDPRLAAKIANLVADEYIGQNLERNLNVANEAARWLAKRIEEQRQKLRDSELALQKYRERHHISVLPELTGEDAVEGIKAEYAKLQAQLANYSKRYTDEHPKTIELKAQINSLKNKIQGLEDINVGSENMEYRVLERELQSNKGIYEILVKRLKEVDLSSTLSVNNVSIIGRAQIPKKPVRPNVMLNLLLSIVVGLFGGVGLGFFVDYLDTTVKSPEDIKNILKSHFLGAVPDMGDKDDLNKDKVVFYEPHSPVSEAYRSIRTEICQFMIQGEDLKALLITSADPQAGKTTTVSNLAISLSQKGNSVIVIDSDLRKPQIDKVFNLSREPGLAEYLSQEADINSIIKETEIENLKVITSGKIPRNPAEIIGCQRMKELIRDLKKRFDFVLFDSPPIISVTDPVILADMVDAVIQVVRSGKTFLPIILRANDKLMRVKTRNLGIILNGMKTYHGDYYYYKYYHYYSETDRRDTQKVGV